jgi:hypothetical protein
MKISGECANFEVDTGNISYTAAFTNQDMTYNVNVNMRQVLGDLYDKYDKFIIVFNGISMWGGVTSYSTTTGISGLGANTIWTLGMSGLNWINNSYNGNINTIAYFPNRFTMPISNNYASTNATSNNGVCFRKPDNPFLTLIIAPYLTRQGGIALANQTGTTGGWDINYSFTIFGLE